ncbi:hypothetical protein [Gracilibacillus thailandensis]
MNGVINSNVGNNERGLLPYPIILAANKGEPEAMKVSCSTLWKLYDKPIHA